MTAKKVVVTAGIVVVWVGGAILAWKAGEAVGSGISKLCVKATDKLLAL